MRVLFLMLLAFTLHAEQYTEFYVISSNATNNLNAGSTTDLAPVHRYPLGTFVRATGVFTPAIGNPQADGVAAGQWASIYTDSGATIATCVAQITNVSTTTITISLKALGGATANVSETALAATCCVGGAWAGPNTNQNPSVTFPWAFIVGTMTNSANNLACFNFKNSALYPWTNTVTLASSTTVPLRISGYSSSPRDGGVCTNTGHFLGSSFVLLTISAANILMTDMAFLENGNSGSSIGINNTGGGDTFRRLYVANMRLTGLSTASCTIEESYFVGNNVNNSANVGGLKLGGTGAIARNCTSRNNGRDGFVIQGGGNLIDCVAYLNTSAGIDILAPGVATTTTIYGCDLEGNTSSGIDFGSIIATQGDQVNIINCRFFATGVGINNSAGVTPMGMIANPTFGSGALANSTDILASVTNAMTLISPLTYTSGQSPWVDYANGNFSQSTSSLDKSRGRGAFFQIDVNAPTNTVSFPDVGATQAADTNQMSYTFAQ
jgi:hypothetical protein